MVRNSATPHVHTQQLILKSLLKDQWPFKEEVYAFSTYWAWVPLNTIWHWRTWIVDHHLKGCSKAAVIASICHMRRESSNQTHPQTPPIHPTEAKRIPFWPPIGPVCFFLCCKVAFVYTSANPPDVCTSDTSKWRWAEHERFSFVFSASLCHAPPPQALPQT